MAAGDKGTRSLRQSWPTRVDMHQDIEDSLAASSISHAGGPQSPARSAENLLNGHRSKGMMELGRRNETTVTDSPGLPAPGACAAASGPALGSASGTVRATPSTSAAAKQRTCLFRVEEDEEEEEEQDPSPLPTQVILRRKPPSITNRLTSRKSAPVLNQIFEEEGESDDDFDLDEGLPPKLSRLKMNMAGNAANLSSGAGSSSSPGTTQKRYHRRKSQGRGSSCSSSETSDDDSESHRRRLDKDSGFSYGWNRRDSSEGPPGSSGGNGGGSSSGQSKPPGEGGGTSGPDRGSPPGGGGNGGGGHGGSGGGSGGGGGGGNKGQDSPSSCCNNSSTTHPSLSSVSRSSRTASRSTELMESLKLMSLCLSSQLQHHRGGRGGRGGGGGGKFIIDPGTLSGGSVKVQEKSAWRMCIGSTGSVDTVTLPTTTALPRTYTAHHHRKTAPHSPPGLPGGRVAHSNLSALKNGVLQLPLCEKTISVNIQRGGGSRDGLLCTSAPASCCQVI